MFNPVRALGVILAMLILAACSSEEPPVSAGGDRAVQATTQPGPGNAHARKPNILLILADDLGYTDLGIFGSEISTPNLDGLARDGMVLTNFHTGPSCAPSRAMLLSGTSNHIAGMGSQDRVAPNQEGKPGYEGHLNSRVATLAELMQDAGYHTYMTGKWHLGDREEESPRYKGFEKSFVLTEPGAGHFSDLHMMGFRSQYDPPRAAYREDGKLVELPEDFYSSRFYAGKMIEYIESGREDGRPFMAYLAFTAPHWPLQALDETIASYEQTYVDGYDALYERRMNRLRELGYIDESITGPPPYHPQQSWQDLTDEQRAFEARRMAVYAAMVDDMDRYIGEVIEYLKQSGQYDNTVILFMSDNGAEGHNFDMPGLNAWIARCCNNSYENLGKGDSYIWPTSKWARASVGPGRIYKGYPTEGGILSPAIISSPLLQDASPARFGGFASIMDIMPTILDLAGVSHPGAGPYKDRTVVAMHGRSMLPVVTSAAAEVHDDEYLIGWELFTKHAVRQGDWKAVNLPPPYGDGKWELYNLAQDPFEQHNLAADMPQMLEQMRAKWDEYAQANGIIIAEGLETRY